MTQNCLNKSRTTYDWCRNCNGRDLDCPEYLASVEHHTPMRDINAVRVVEAVPSYETLGGETPNHSQDHNLWVAKFLGNKGLDKPFYLGHVELMHNVVLPKSKMIRIIRKGMEGIL